MKIKIYVGLLLLALVGFGDATYLAREHFSQSIPPCTTHVLPILTDCGKVLRSEYAQIAGIPLALLGMAHYLVMMCWLFWWGLRKSILAARLAVLQATVGFGFSVFLVYLQIWVIKAICLYCMGSAFVSTIIFGLALYYFSNERKRMLVEFSGKIYKFFLRRILFKFDSETIHEIMVKGGEIIGSTKLVRGIVSGGLKADLPSVSQTIDQLKFVYPVGLAAGFDYEARLTKSLAPWGFGFQTVGTITNKAYGGNPKPMLGRLPKSKSLLVNKGFKNPGAEVIVKKLAPISFDIPVGISIGRTNSRELVDQQQSVEDIVKAFSRFEISEVKHAYYELNISCPNLFGNVEFYSTKNLSQLLDAVDNLKLSRPVFVKMPIDKSEAETLKMLSVISKFQINGVIFGNLQKNRQHPSLDQIEVAKFAKGNFSGKPTFEDSNRLIKLAYKHYKDRFVIIGCGGIFSAEDAYEKIKNGATLVQLITGLVYQGPQLVMEINYGLVDLLKKDGFKNIAEAVGTNLIN